MSSVNTQFSVAIESKNPFTGEILKTFEPLRDDELESRVARAYFVAQKTLNRLSESRQERTQLLAKAAELLRAQSRELATLMVTEMGKTLKSAQQEVEKCAACCDYYSQKGLAALEPVPIPGGETRYEPIGILLAVMPWNFPFWQVIRAAAPNLLCGNSVLLKHASNVPQCAFAIEKVFVQAGFEVGAFQTLLLPSSAIAKLLDDSRVSGVTLTGSEQAGSEVARQAGSLIKKSVLELGGSDPFIVMPSCNFEEAVKTAVEARLICNGQSCIAAKRFIVHTSIYERFRAAFVSKMKAIRLGDPMADTTELGPLVSEGARTELQQQVDQAVQAGAKVLVGGVIPPGRGALYPATVIENIPPQARIYQEEVFGPIASLYRVQSLDEAIELANATRFGLGSSFWSQDEAEIEIAQTRIRAGSVFVNAMMASDSARPFGGVKASGYGRELGISGLHEFANLKTIVRG